MSQDKKRASKQLSSSSKDLKLKLEQVKIKTQQSENPKLYRSSFSFKLQKKGSQRNLIEVDKSNFLHKDSNSQGFKRQKLKLKTQSANTSLKRQKYGGEGVEEKNTCGLSQIDKIKYQLAIQKRLRESLERQIEVLRKEVLFLNNFGTSVRSSVNQKRNIEDQSNKDKILGRLNRKRQGVTGIDKDNDSTGILSAKTITNENKINQIYQEYVKNRVVPSLQNLHEIAKNYFQDYKENYSKLLILFEQRKQDQKNRLYSKMEDLMFLFQVPIFYKQKPKQLLQSLSKQKQRQSRQKRVKESTQKTLLMPQKQSQAMEDKIKVKQQKQAKKQLRSNQQLYQQFVDVVNALIRSGSLLKKISKSESLAILLIKIKEIKEIKV